LKKAPHFFILAVALALTACSPTAEKGGQESSPNFILIYTDEMQFSDLGCYGGQIPTPNIDQLASEGLMFTSAYTTASMCTPSRYSVISGQFPGRCSAPSFLKDSPVTEPYNIAWNTWITPDKLTLPRVLSKNGYVTGMSGKWHVGKVPQGTVLPKFSGDESLDDPDTEAELIEQQSVYQSLVESLAGFDDASSVVWGNYDGFPL
jgi:arylsulfatase A-like enzyme